MFSLFRSTNWEIPESHDSECSPRPKLSTFCTLNINWLEPFQESPQTLHAARIVDGAIKTYAKNKYASFVQSCCSMVVDITSHWKIDSECSTLASCHQQRHIFRSVWQGLSWPIRTLILFQRSVKGLTIGLQVELCSMGHVEFYGSWDAKNAAESKQAKIWQNPYES